MTDVNTPNDKGDTPLMRAVKKGRLKAVKQLISDGANLHLKNLQGEDAMMLAQSSEK